MDISNVCSYFFLRGKNIDPDEITLLLGIKPTTKHRVGEIHGKNQDMVWKTGLWLLDSTAQVQSTEIEEHIIWVLDQLEPMKLQLTSIMDKSDVHIELRIIFSLFTRNWDSIINVKTIERLAELKIPISISTWYLGYSEEANEIDFN